ncbi:redoxin domain-containing protein [Rudanella paleaurantiibacter]|uniref:Redoxin domain-containing protein n=1 Tax=Rudanella paleaurantiibacter TaxID=2614655 RepID=A0A7J5U5A8_9BACT|nr:TlpA disulfide reductase family protein [Rudanella paleaurantiibacter]KAB7732841.1 redoxin domain-containing protein [Rudanella paleaurantiibacter]
MKNYLLLLLTLQLFSCRDAPKIRITGNLENVPDGHMIFYTRSRQTGKVIDMDSCQLKNGRFEMVFSKEEYPEAIWVFLNHREPKTGIKRVFSFKTNLKYRGAPLGSDHFYLEDGIQVNGKVTEMTFKGFTPNKGIKLVSLDRPLVVGRQTQVAYNDTLDFGSLNQLDKIEQAISNHPYSYYYLYNLPQLIPNFSSEELLTAFERFDPAVQQSETGQKLLNRIEGHKNVSLSFATQLETPSGGQGAVLDKQYSYNLVVLWASWCGPCRQEIPDLKQLYTSTQKGQKLRIVSVSVDEDSDAWQKALTKEQMPWSQLLVSGAARQHVNRLFRFDGSIPTMLLIDREGRLVKKVVGFEAGGLKEIEMAVSRG